MLAVLLFAHAQAAVAIFGDVRDRLGCQLPGHTLYPFCNSSLPTKDRVADLIPRIPNELKPGFLTARAVVAISPTMDPAMDRAMEGWVVASLSDPAQTLSSVAGADPFS